MDKGWKEVVKNIQSLLAHTTAAYQYKAWVKTQLNGFELGIGLQELLDKVASNPDVLPEDQLEQVLVTGRQAAQGIKAMAEQQESVGEQTLHGGELKMQEWDMSGILRSLLSCERMGNVLKKKSDAAMTSLKEAAGKFSALTDGGHHPEKGWKKDLATHADEKMVIDAAKTAFSGMNAGELEAARTLLDKAGRLAAV